MNPDLITTQMTAEVYRERARRALAEYDARTAGVSSLMFWPEMAGLLSEALRGWLAASDRVEGS